MAQETNSFVNTNGIDMLSKGIIKASLVHVCPAKPIQSS